MLNARDRSTTSRCTEYHDWPGDWPSGWSTPVVLGWSPWRDESPVQELQRFWDGTTKAVIPAEPGSQRMLPADSLVLFINGQVLVHYVELQRVRVEVLHGLDSVMVCGGKKTILCIGHPTATTCRQVAGDGAGSSVCPDWLGQDKASSCVVLPRMHNPQD